MGVPTVELNKALLALPFACRLAFEPLTPAAALQRGHAHAGQHACTNLEAARERVKKLRPNCP